MALMMKNKIKICGLFVMMLLAVTLLLMMRVPTALSDDGDSTGAAVIGGATPTPAPAPAPAPVTTTTTKPLTVIMNGAATTSDVPVVQMGNQIYVPIRFVAESLNYPVEWDGSNRTVYIGVRPLGADMVTELTPLTGVKIEQPVTIGAIGYPNGYNLAPFSYTDVRWNLDKRYWAVVINMGIPDNSNAETAEFEVIADDDTIATEVLSKDDGLKDFSYNVSGVTSFRISCISGGNCALISPRAQ
jgi:hypothetical protein